MKLTATFFKDRSFLGSMLTSQGSYPLAVGDMCPVLNVPHRLVLAIRVPSDSLLRAELGPKVLFFQGAGGALFALHAGYTDARGVLMATDGSLRIGYEDVVTIAERAKKSKKGATLTFVERGLNETTKLLGTRISDSSAPSAQLRKSVAETLEFAGKKPTTQMLWKCLAATYRELGCTLCHEW
jgi:hypothetical protein